MLAWQMDPQLRTQTTFYRRPELGPQQSYQLSHTCLKLQLWQRGGVWGPLLNSTSTYLHKDTHLYTYLKLSIFKEMFIGGLVFFFEILLCFVCLLGFLFICLFVTRAGYDFLLRMPLSATITIARGLFSISSSALLLPMHVFCWTSKTSTEQRM